MDNYDPIFESGMFSIEQKLLRLLAGAEPRSIGLVQLDTDRFSPRLLFFDAETRFYFSLYANSQALEEAQFACDQQQAALDRKGCELFRDQVQILAKNGRAAVAVPHLFDMHLDDARQMPQALDLLIQLIPTSEVLDWIIHIYQHTNDIDRNLTNVGVGVDTNGHYRIFTVDFELEFRRYPNEDYDPDELNQKLARIAQLLGVRYETIEREIETSNTLRQILKDQEPREWDSLTTPGRL